MGRKTKNSEQVPDKNESSEGVIINKLKILSAKKNQIIKNIEKLCDSPEELKKTVIPELMEKLENIVDDMNYLNLEKNFAYEPVYDDLTIIQEKAWKALAGLPGPRTPWPSAIQPSEMSKPTTTLPKIQLPTFGGDFKDWVTFHSMFDAVIHKSQLSEIEKFQHLKGLLKNDALRIIEHFTLTGSNYELAYAALKQRYANPRISANFYLNSLLNYKTVHLSTRANLQNYLTSHADLVNSYKKVSVDNHYDYLLFQICYKHLDTKLQNLFDSKFSVDTFPTYDDLMKFVQNYIRTLELHEEESNRKNIQLNSNANTKPKLSFYVRENQCAVAKCPLCSQEHQLFKCSKFHALNIPDRVSFIEKKLLCVNCLGTHNKKYCKSTSRCKVCQRFHHTLLHKNNQAKQDTQKDNSNLDNVNVVACCSSKGLSNSEILLGTVLGYIRTRNSTVLPVRMLIDSGSQVSCITAGLVKKLGLKVNASATQIQGIGDAKVNSFGKVNFEILVSPSDSKGIELQAVVLSHISHSLPKFEAIGIREKFGKYKLADPYFDVSNPIDVLIGADKFCEILKNKPIIKGQPNGVPTIFGLALVGEIPIISKRSPNKIACLATTENLDEMLRKFWELEEVQGSSELLEDPCETLFKTTTVRNETGRFVVALPFNPYISNLGSNREHALQRFRILENKFKNNSALLTQYSAFMDEYLNLGHMQLATSESPYVIPHSAVFKDSSTTKLRVVFDASNVSDSGKSLNETLYIGPKLQANISHIISGFRIYAVALVGDIKMMYRQILVRPEDRKFQHIFWRSSHLEAVKEYELNTITYGLTCSPFIAQRVLKQLVIDDGEPFPLASQALLYQTYMDDIVAGGNTPEEAIELYLELTKLLGLGGFFPRKWSSSSAKVLAQIPQEHQEKPVTIHCEGEIVHKILGLRWDPQTDAFIYYSIPFQGSPTKRTILSYIARMFDPLGWLTPYTFACKTFIQELWLVGISWDENLPKNLNQQWAKLANISCYFSNISITRHIPVQNADEIQIIGFCDASEKGYACALYTRCRHNSQISIQLLSAKSKVAPLKSLTIPKLELNAALLLAKLYASYQTFFKRLPQFKQYLFSDSQVALSWIRSPPHRLKPFVANRVAAILEITKPDCWFFVDSENNAADCASRGIYSVLLDQNSIWWKGPSFLQQHPLMIENSKLEIELENLPEMRPVNCLTILTEPANTLISLTERVSTLSKLQRIVAYVIKFVTAVKTKVKQSKQLTVSELKSALLKYCFVCQNQMWEKEIKQLSQGVTPSNWLSLSPFLDSIGVVRVGGRLKHANLSFDSKHPILIPHKSKLAKLIINYYHKLTLHGGPQLTISTIRQQFWIPRIGNLVKSTIFQCIHCKRFSCKPEPPKMADLPATRLEQLRPFLRSGVDFAGPFTLKETLRKNARLFKGYLCIFVCFSTKAVHLEVVLSLSTDSFLAAVDRFVARRGLCAHIHCDNGTNFVGAANKLKEINEFLINQSEYFSRALCERKIEWHFNPPGAPHFGGIWEAAVKSCKTHLHRTAGNHTFTLEEFNTFICRIEAVLNSRPLYPIASDPSDNVEFLTPGHFLIGSSLLSVPELPLHEIKINRLTRWQLINQNIQSFWRKWSSSYLQSIIPRRKWSSDAEPLTVGDLVLVKHSKQPPLSWPMARVIETFPSTKDDKTRVVRIKLQNSILVRPVHTLCKLL